MENSLKVEQGDICLEYLEKRDENIEILEKLARKINEIMENHSSRKDRFLQVTFNNYKIFF